MVLYETDICRFCVYLVFLNFCQCICVCVCVDRRTGEPNDAHKKNVPVNHEYNITKKGPQSIFITVAAASRLSHQRNKWFDPDLITTLDFSSICFPPSFRLHLVLVRFSCVIVKHGTQHAKMNMYVMRWDTNALATYAVQLNCWISVFFCCLRSCTEKLRRIKKHARSRSPTALHIHAHPYTFILW